MKILPFVLLGILLGRAIDVAVWWVVVGAVVCSLLGYFWRKVWAGELYTALAIILWALCASLIRTPQIIITDPSIVTLPTTITSTPYTSGRWQRADGKVVVEGKNHKVLLNADTTLTLSLGEVGSARGYLRPLPEGSYGKLMHHRGYIGTLYISSPTDWHSEGRITNLTIVARKAQHTLSERIDRLGLGRNESAVVKAMLIGERGEIERSQREEYSRAGASHLLAISGLHIGIVAMLVWWLCWFLPITGRRGHIVRNIIASIVMILYAFVAGLSPSVVRATVMFVVAQMALAYGTSKSSVGTLAGALTMMLLLNPNNLYDISFQLSAVAVIGIAIGFQPAMELLGGESGSRVRRTLIGVVVVGICSTLATLPLVAHTFGTMSLVGIFLNPIVILTAEIIVLGGFIWVSLPFGWLAPVARVVVGGAAWLQNRVVEYAANLSWSAVDIALPKWVVVVCYVAMGAGVLYSMVYTKKRKWRVES